ncbi:hypothetical protein [Rhizorhabdus histidinilytica]|uniref:Uncharacterized protein n=1 Tax=Rhizorhabdus histidinilytica TaxID=439228 RepID=A0A1T5BQ78_9SPHN|nr:hypothetical protein [Rhizorhabdus histidinilytica]SKB49388.1 hypothetical protein SAMN06295920_103197 [Rhizorhabdus histidinilytica]
MSRRRPGWEDEVPMEDMEAAALRFHYWAGKFAEPAPDIADVLAARLPDARHLIAIWEPLATKAPNPSRCLPFCCLRRTVVFYHRPYVVGWPRGGRDMDGVFHPDWNKGFIEYDQIETRLGSDDIVEFDGDRFEVGGGHVCWSKSRPGAHKRWWMRFWARRQAEVARSGGRQ